MDFGFTNEEQVLERVQAFRDAAVADGWTIEPTYPNESVDRACRLRREGYVIGILTRRSTGPRWRFEAKTSGWCPRGIAIDLPDEYDWHRIQANARQCPVCKARDVETVRVVFANRACLNCAPALREKLETPDWCD